MCEGLHGNSREHIAEHVLHQKGNLCYWLGLSSKVRVLQSIRKCGDCGKRTQVWGPLGTQSVRSFIQPTDNPTGRDIQFQSESFSLWVWCKTYVWETCIFDVLLKNWLGTPSKPIELSWNVWPWRLKQGYSNPYHGSLLLQFTKTRTLPSKIQVGEHCWLYM